MNAEEIARRLPGEVPALPVPATPQRRTRRPPAAAYRRRRQPWAARLACGSVLGLLVIPGVIWHRLIGDTLGRFRWKLDYSLLELAPWFLLLAGVCFLVPVALSAGRTPDSRMYPRARRAYLGWGVVLYLLGLGLAVQMAQLWTLSH